MSLRILFTVVFQLGIFFAFVLPSVAAAGTGKNIAPVTFFQIGQGVCKGDGIEVMALSENPANPLLILDFRLPTSTVRVSLNVTSAQKFVQSLEKLRATLEQHNLVSVPGTPYGLIVDVVPCTQETLLGMALRRLAPKHHIACLTLFFSKQSARQHVQVFLTLEELSRLQELVKKKVRL